MKRIAAVEWSGRKAGESVIVRGRNSADIWRKRAGGRPGARQRQASSASVGSVKPGCLAGRYNNFAVVFPEGRERIGIGSGQGLSEIEKTF